MVVVFGDLSPRRPKLRTAMLANLPPAGGSRLSFSSSGSGGANGPPASPPMSALAAGVVGDARAATATVGWAHGYDVKSDMRAVGVFVTALLRSASYLR